MWTDGSCNAEGVAGRGGWAALIERDGGTEQLVGSAMETTQNRMELTAVCEALGESWPVPVKRLGILDLFGESGTPEGLYERHGIDTRGIKESVAAFCSSTPPRRA